VRPRLALQLPSLAPRSHGVLAQVHLPRALSSATPWLAHPCQRRTDKRNLRRLHARPLPLQRRCCTLLHVCALPSLCRRAEPPPPSLPPHAGRVTSMQYMAIKGGQLCISSATAPCPPPVSRHCRITSVFPSLRRCQAASPHLSPRVQVPELREAPELLPVQFKSHLHCC
jgi:hypothetical protein